MPELAFEDLTPGRVFDLGTVTVDRDQMIDFARQYDPQPFHLDEQAGQESIFKGLAASGWFTTGLWMRAYVDHVLLHATSLASPGGEEIRWPAPVFAGDVLTATLAILDARRSRSRPEMGLVTLGARMHRGDTLVFSATFTGMFGVREP